MLYKLFIGHNNRTKKLEEKKAVAIVAKTFEGFTAYKGLGYWQGQAERTLIIEIETPQRAGVVKVAKELATVLQQQAIGLAQIGKLDFITA